MLPSLLKGSYREYKADTDVVAAWLTTTAAEHGYGGNQSGKPSPAGRRLKGKARKQAKAAVTETPSSSTAPKVTYTVRIKEFEPLAAFIAGVGTVSVPTYIAKTLARVISVRKTFAERLASNGVKITAQAETGHSFFVEVLEKVQQLLKPLTSSSQTTAQEATPAADKPAESTGAVKNIFGSLEVYHTSVDFENAPDAVPAPSSPKANYVAEQADSTLDIYFAVTTLLSDFADLKTEIRALWCEHAAGSLDLAAVSVATNAAIELARSLEEEIEPLLQKAGGGHAMLDRYFRLLCKADGIDASALPSAGWAFNPEAYDIAEKCLINTLVLLASYCKVTDPQQVCLQDYNGKFGWYDEGLRGKDLTNTQRWTQGMTAVLELMPDLSFLVDRLGKLTVVDELTRGLAYVMDQKLSSAPLWLAFALQVYLDILHNFSQECDGFSAMQRESRRIKESMLDVPEHTRGPVLRAAGLWDADPIAAAREIGFSTGMLPRTKSTPFKFLRRNPLYCGLLIHNMRSTVQNTGLHYAARPGALVGVVQLHNALHQEKLLAKDWVWEDLQTLLELQGKASFFVGDLPKTKEAYFTNYCLSIGTSVTHWAAGQRKSKKPVKIHSDNRRNLMPMGYLSLQANHRLEHPGKREPWTPAALGEILGESFARRYIDSREHMPPEFKEKVELAKHRYAQLSPAGLVREVAVSLQHEKPGLCFNFFTMHNQAWFFLESLQEAFEEVLGQSSSSRPLSQEQTLPFVPGFSFAAAVGKSLGRSQSIPANDALLRVAAAIMQWFIREGFGRKIKDSVGKDVKPEDVADLDQALDQWGLDRSDIAEAGGGGPEMEMLMRLLMSAMR